MMNSLNLWVLVEILYYLKSIAYMALNSERKCLNSLKQKECVKCRKRCATVSKQYSSAVYRKCSRTNSFIEV